MGRRSIAKQFPVDTFLTVIYYQKNLSAPCRSYLLRLSYESPRFVGYYNTRFVGYEPNDPPAWCAIVESPVNDDRHGFTSLESLFNFLEQEAVRLKRAMNPKQDRPDA